jgi:nitroreductase/NAD-dependent dihydropyrimidine dehydrogenase PreA subunit
MISINKETCKQCGLCAAVCADGIILFKEKQYPRQMPGTSEVCLKCGHCVAICPTSSLTHPDIPLEQCPPIRPELKLSPEQVEQFIRSRRSIREFKDQPVPRQLVQKLIDVAHYAPTGHNNQDVEWLVIDDKATLLAIEKAGTGWLKDTIVQQPQMAAVMNMPILLQKQEHDLDLFLRKAPALVIALSTKDNAMAAIDATIAMTTLELAAPSLGLGGCWAGFVYFMANAYPPVQQILSLPADKAGCGVMMLGYPKYQYARTIARRPAHIMWKESEAKGN